MNTMLRIGMYILLALAVSLPAAAREHDWPRTVALDEGTVTIYEPQVDEMEDDFIRFRAALAYRAKPGDEPVFGAGWFESDLQVDRLSATAHPVGMKVTQTRFPVEADVQTRLSEAMAQPAFASNFTFSLDDLERSAKMAQAEAEAAQKLKTTPPEIIYRDHPALLVNIDGEPILRDVENSPYEAVINTPYPLIRDGDVYFLNAAQEVWYRGSSATGPFRFTDVVPAALEELVRQENAGQGEEDVVARAESAEKITAANAPEIVVSTKPAELIVTEGPAAFVPLVDELLVLNNSDDDVFMHLDEQAYYIVLAGRWYRSASLNGPWEFRDSDALPAAFANIPGDSEQADSRVYVAGTEEAQEAVLDAQVPQTAAVKRGQADVEVQYDGAPAFETVDGTDMVYIANTGSTVLVAGGLYYLVEDGVWYVSGSHEGPWEVALQRPDQVETILPSSPVYNVKYVHVYDHTPDVVYVGYTPGYLGSYVYHNTVFYGSGWYYRPWVSPRWYYPHHRTWGFHVRYDSWYGWNFGLSWAWGPFHFSYWPGGYWHHHHYWHHRHYGYWGPHGYRPRHHHHRRHHHGHRDRYDRPGRHRSHPYERHHNLYADSNQRARVAETRNKEPRGFDARRGDATPVGNAYAGTGFDKGLVPRQAQKKKAAYASTKPVSRNELALKAGDTNTGFDARSKKVSAGGGKARAWGKSVDPVGKTVTRTDLASKAKSGDQRFKASQKPVTPVSGSKSLKSGNRKVSRSDLGQLKVKDNRVKKQPASKTTRPAGKSYAKTRVAKPPVTKGHSYSKTPVSKSPSSKGKSFAKAPVTKSPASNSKSYAKKPVTKSPSAKSNSYSKRTVTKSPVPKTRSYAKAPSKAGPPGTGSKSRAYNKSKSMPVVKLTRPVQKSAPVQARPKVSAPPARQASRASVPKQYSKASTPKQARPSSPPKQKQSAPVSNKQKQGRAK